MKNNRILIVLLYASLFFTVHIGSTENSTAQQENTFQFAFVDPYNFMDEMGGIYLLGEYNPSLPVFLLNKNDSKYCKGKTGSPENYKDEAIEIILTPVVEADGCGATNEYSVALIGLKEVSYEIINLEEVNDLTLRRELDRIARSSGLLEELLEQNRGLSYSPEELLNSPPKVVSLGDAQVVEYWFPWAIGPRVLVVNGKASALTGQCSFRTLGSGTDPMLLTYEKWKAKSPDGL